jgi:hypothetical protein
LRISATGASATLALCCSQGWSARAISTGAPLVVHGLLIGAMNTCCPSDRPLAQVKYIRPSGNRSTEPSIEWKLPVSIRPFEVYGPIGSFASSTYIRWFGSLPLSAV